MTIHTSTTLVRDAHATIGALAFARDESAILTTTIEQMLVREIGHTAYSYLEVCERMRALSPHSVWDYTDGAAPGRRCPDRIYQTIREWIRRPYLGDTWNLGAYRVGLASYDAVALNLAEIESMP